MRKTLDEFIKEYSLPIGSDEAKEMVQKWKAATWEIDEIYGMQQAEKISLSMARELTRGVIDKYASALITSAVIETKLSAANGVQSLQEDGTHNFNLFKYFNDEHGLVLTDSELMDIISNVNKFNSLATPSPYPNQEGGLPELPEPIISQQDLEAYLKSNQEEHEAPFKFFATPKKTI